MSRFLGTDILIVIGVVATFIAVFALANGHGSAQSPAAADPDAPFALIAAGSATAAPNFTLKTTDGGSITLSKAVANGPVVIDFWAIWCGPCKLELPIIDSMSRAYQSRGVQFYGINSDADADEINQFFSKEKVSFPMLVDSGGGVASAYGVTAIPFVAVIDRHGRMRASDMGYDPNTQTDLSACLDSLLKEQ